MRCSGRAAESRAGMGARPNLEETRVPRSPRTRLATGLTVTAEARRGIGGAAMDSAPVAGRGDAQGLR